MAIEHRSFGPFAAEPAREGRLPAPDLTRGYFKTENDQCEGIKC